jgi:hypothetical protein
MQVLRRMHICERGNIIYAIYVKEEIETKRDNKTKQDKAVKARDVGNLIQQATDTWQ